MNRSSPTPLTRILIADSQAVVRSGLRLAIEDQPDMRVAAEAIDAPSAFEAAHASRPDVAVVELELPGGRALDTIRRLLTFPNLETVLIAGSDEPELLKTLLSEGARAALSRRAPISDLLAAIRAVREDPNGRPLPLESFFERDPSEADDDWTMLTTRERDVARLVAEGSPYRVIAARLGISEHTVKNHLRRIYDKLDISSRVELAVQRVTRTGRE